MLSDTAGELASSLNSKSLGNGLYHHLREKRVGGSLPVHPPPQLEKATTKRSQSLGLCDIPTLCKRPSILSSKVINTNLSLFSPKLSSVLLGDY